MLFLPQIDLGIAQNPMFGDGIADGWAAALPGWAPTRVAMSAAFTREFEAGIELLVAFGWAIGLLLVVWLGPAPRVAHVASVVRRSECAHEPRHGVGVEA